MGNWIWKETGEVYGQLKLALIRGEVYLKQAGCSKESECPKLGEQEVAKTTENFLLWLLQCCHITFGVISRKKASGAL